MGLLKRFVHWIFLYFPNVTVESVKMLSFWDRVGERLSVLGRNGDCSVGKFFPLRVSIYASVRKMGSSSGVCKSPNPFQNVPPPPLPYPHVPNPFNPFLGESGGVAHHAVQGCHRLPDSSRSPRFSFRDGECTPAPDLSFNPFSSPSDTVLSPPGFSQNDAGLMARPTIFSPSCPILPTKNHSSSLVPPLAAMDALLSDPSPAPLADETDSWSGALTESDLKSVRIYP